MKQNQSKRIAIDPERLDRMIRTGHGKPISNDKTKKRRWTLAELERITGINYQTISKIRRGSANAKEQNMSTVAALAMAFDVDMAYLTGDQDVPHLTPQENQERQREVQRITDTVSFISRYGLRVVLDDPSAPTAYSVYDADNNLIEEKKDIRELLPLVEMVHGLFATGHDLVSLYFQDAWLYEK